jgi:protein tyrosine/serine phosphatase
MSSLLESTANTRQVLPGSFRYLRSDVPLAPTEQDVAFLLAHGVTTLIDLRSEDEILRRPCPLAEHPAFVYRSMPVTGGNALPASVQDVPCSYLRMVDGQMTRILRTIRDAEDGVMFFCAAGKDRTGVVSALLQRQACMAREAIIADYVRSGDNLKEMLAGFVQKDPEINIAVCTPYAKYMDEFLDLLETHKWEQP